MNPGAIAKALQESGGTETQDVTDSIPPARDGPKANYPITVIPITEVTKDVTDSMPPGRDGSKAHYPTCVT